MKKEIRGKTLAYWEANANEDYKQTPISVLKYITILEDELKVKNNVAKSNVMSSQIMDNAQLREQINKNRDEIEKLLSSELPIDIVKFNIEILSARNERFIKQLKE